MCLTDLSFGSATKSQKEFTTFHLSHPLVCFIDSVYSVKNPYAYVYFIIKLTLLKF